ncbi:hypothetical protein N7468_008364 [Penicillium chermesinum]|uniref:Isochorismatase-like domain-containing protein n=1 Tax=Penicillium chermesinum TaxID=63820 RepID=A0A9W9NPP2_9EURO|nr:uncharacterized protein N7468_008364 [Penicillium chermesinum]KAJ5223822.1 hypothetical protein N7468_008364 [Penicillium chermesinum]
MDPRPLTIFSTLALSIGQPELEAHKPFSDLIAPLGTFEMGSPEVQIDSRFAVDKKDVIVCKTRWSATMGNSLEQILRANKIDTVIISGLSLSGVVMSTVYRLFDLDFRVFVITDNVIELPVGQTAGFSKVICEMLLPKMNLKAISLDEALWALELAKTR